MRTTGGWWHLNWGERARGNDWSRIVEWYQTHQTHGFQVFDAIIMSRSQQAPVNCILISQATI